MKTQILLSAVAITILGCATPSIPGRVPASQQSDAPAPVHTLNTPMYSWTNNPSALQDPGAFIAKKFDLVKSCNEKLASNPKGEVEGCEGNQLAAGPGVYTCDNPFTSADYGNILVVMNAVGGHTNIGNGTGMAPTDQIDRALSGNSGLDGILYDFRPNDFGGRAVAVRSAGLLDTTQTYAIDVRPSDWKPFAQHAAFACTPDTPLADILKAWADHVGFFSATFFFAASGTDEGGYGTKTEMNANGRIAALISDLTALPADKFQTMLDGLNKAFPKKLQLDHASCQETDAMTPQKCFSDRLYRSLIEDTGTPNSPTYAWNYALTVKVLTQLKVLSTADIPRLGTMAKLTKFLSDRFASNAAQLTRATEAYRCMMIVHDSVAKNNFGMWADQ
ncbi:MAG: hypothetical protein ACXVCI_05660 [Bdellovibrionota bacterium]